jgi:hypothetical protein
MQKICKSGGSVNATAWRLGQTTRLGNPGLGAIFPACSRGDGWDAPTGLRSRGGVITRGAAPGWFISPRWGWESSGDPRRALGSSHRSQAPPSGDWGQANRLPRGCPTPTALNVLEHSRFRTPTALPSSSPGLRSPDRYPGTQRPAKRFNPNGVAPQTPFPPPSRPEPLCGSIVTPLIPRVGLIPLRPTLGWRP